jgi:hypothetical protein
MIPETYAATPGISTFSSTTTASVDVHPFKGFVTVRVYPPAAVTDVL